MRLFPIAGRQARDASEVVEVLQGREPRVQPVGFQEDAGLLADLLRPCAHVVPQHAGLAGRRFQQAEEEADGGGLPRPVGAEEAVDRARRHVDREVVDGPHGPEVARQPDGADGDPGVGARHAPPLIRPPACATSGRPARRAPRPRRSTPSTAAAASPSVMPASKGEAPAASTNSHVPTCEADRRDHQAATLLDRDPPGSPAADRRGHARTRRAGTGPRPDAPGGRAPARPRWRSAAAEARRIRWGRPRRS